jgi:hypothetical protein
MAKGNPKPSSHRQAKPHKAISIKLAEHLCPIAENSLKGQTEAIELGLTLLQFLATEATQGNKSSVDLLAEFGVEAVVKDGRAIVVHKSD